ncbi:hypothetical protein IFM89_033844 [Coptis chinensis]|uniref:High-affinity nitrate transporter n=1 Tax=Coptis chinensis TaxID=261450 RepID=A0A835HPG2_9MAGN|nr:hypothetical protein IFM89_033844 [Coptis chinensis]
MASHILISALILLCFFGTCYGKGLFSSLQRTLVANASTKQGEVLKSGLDKITVTWTLNQSFPASTADAYKQVKVKLCFAPISQKDRAWRKTKDDLTKDKTCQFTIADTPYDASTVQEWLVERDVPTATYFVRVYALDSSGHEMAYGQTTDAKKTTNLFEIQGISGRHVSLDIAAGCFSAFSVVSLFGFFYVEKKKAKRAQ